MSSYNKVILIGNLGKDPEMRYTATQQPVANFTVATSEKYNGIEKTEWHTIVAWGKTAELCQSYLKKGSKVLIEGKIQSRAWESKTGEKRVSFEIVAQNVNFLSPRAEEHKPIPSPTPAYNTPQFAGFSDDEVPF